MFTFLCLQTAGARPDAAPPGVGTSASGPSVPPAASRRLLEEALAKPAPYPMIVAPAGFWVDGQEHDCPFDSRGNPVLPQPPHAASWRAKIETDETAKCYRRYFVGLVSAALLNILTSARI